MQAFAKAKGFEEPGYAKFIFSDPRMAVVWLVVRIYVGWQWFTAGMEKFNDPAWTGSESGSAIAGFVGRALPQTTGAHPNVYTWYASFLQTYVMPHASVWAYAITFGEILVGLGLIVGLFTGIAAFFGGLMNANYLLAGTVSTNPLLFILATWIVLAWRVAGYIGLDFFALQLLGVPGQPGKVFKHDVRVATPTLAPNPGH